MSVDRSPGPSRTVVRLYRAVVHLFPARFRREFGDDLVQLFRDRYRETRRAHGRVPGRFWIRTGGDILWQAILEHGRRWRLLRAATGDAILAGDGGPPPDPARSPVEHRGDSREGMRNMLDTLRRDGLYALRTFARHPAFTVVALVTLALGIGANTAIFGVINGVLLQPLRYGDADELMVVWETNPGDGIETSPTSGGTFQDWREQNRSFQDLTAWAFDTFVLQEQDESVSLDGVLVYPNFFSILRVSPVLGRGFAADDADPGRRGTVVIVSHALWRERWGADPGLLGRTVRLDGQPVTIVGVMRPDVAAPDPDIDLWIPAGFLSRNWWDRYGRNLEVYGRLRSGVTRAQAQQDLSAIAAGLRAGEFADVYRGWDVRLMPFRDHVLGNIRPTLWIAFASVGLVLLIACVNIANMLLARAAAREREMAVRVALGAGRPRITRQLLTESVMLALIGGIVGVGFARFTHGLILSFEPGIIPRAEELALDWWALLFALGVSVLTGVIFGLVPALQGSKVDLQESLTQGGNRSVTAGQRQRRIRAVLVTSQLALTVVLLTGSGLLIRSLLELGKVDPGFEPEANTAARIFLDGRRYDTEDKVRQYFRDVVGRLETLPSVVEVGASSALPMDPLGINYDLPYRFQGQEDLDTEELPEADFRVVTPGYFEALGVRLVSGRLFNEFDGPDAPFVALVNESMAKRQWPNESPLGKRFETPSTDWHWFEVVGVVADTRYYGLDAEPRPEIYVNHAQVPRTAMTFVVRTAGDPASLADPVRREIMAHDRGQPTHSVLTLESMIAETIAAERFYALVLGIFAAVAVVLSAVGVYGVLSYWVSQRTHEIGVRMALGADRALVRRQVVGHGMALTGLGIGIGLVGAFFAARVLSTVLYAVGTNDPVTFVMVTLVLLVIAFAACWIPAFRASRVDPMLALRD